MSTVTTAAALIQIIRSTDWSPQPPNTDCEYGIASCNCKGEDPK